MYAATGTTGMLLLPKVCPHALGRSAASSAASNGAARLGMPATLMASEVKDFNVSCSADVRKDAPRGWPPAANEADAVRGRSGTRASYEAAPDGGTRPWLPQSQSAARSGWPQQPVRSLRSLGPGAGLLRA